VVAEQVRARKVAHHAGKGIARLHLGGAVGADDAHRHAGGGSHQGRQQVQRVSTRPLQVVEDQQRARRSGHIGQESGHSLEHQASFLLGGQCPEWWRLDGELRELRQ
jgi:hypothetical protein